MGEGVCDLEVLSVRLRGAGGLVNGVRLVCGPACDGACLVCGLVGWWWVGDAYCACKGETVITVGSKGVEAGAWLPATEHAKDVSPYALNAMVFGKGLRTE